MFGYVLPILSSLPEEERKRYKAAYCGLCRSLKAQYGFRARFLVNYDMTFLYCLLSKEKEAQMDHCSCPAKPFCKKDCMPNDETMLYAADLTVLLSWWKLKDGVQDSGFFKRVIYRMGLGLYRKAYVRAATRRKRENEAFEQQLAYLNELEKSRCPSMDRVADTFASLLRVCTGEQTSVSEQRILQTLLYHVGRYLYLVDAL
ncbi:MAG: hypothetical protein IKM59_02340, partial [Oscillospiraceae bacterium]|nr:hypothetical protein [Oscillospiraceae bacterium]